MTLSRLKWICVSYLNKIELPHYGLYFVSLTSNICCGLDSLVRPPRRLSVGATHDFVLGRDKTPPPEQDRARKNLSPVSPVFPLFRLWTLKSCMD